MQLPRELSAWADLLAEFPLDTAQELGSLIFRLSVAIGPLRHGRLTGIEEPDGFEGLASTGGIEHLLPSEWLLSDEVPIEFDRRAAMGEQLFYRLNRIDFKKGLSSVLLFDAGPSKLGTPAIVHLALLILFVRRAESAKADFYWGILQDPETGLSQSVGREDVTRLINDVSPLMPSQDNIKAWHEILEALSGKPENPMSIDDLHVVGYDDIKNEFSQAGLITINEALNTPNKTLEIVIRKKNSDMPSTLELDVPTDPLAVRILRDPYTTIKDQPAETDITRRSRGRICKDHTPLFSRNFMKLAVTIGDEDIELWTIPNSPKGNPGQPKYFSPNGSQKIIGVEIVKKTIRTITTDGIRIYFNRFPKIDGLLNINYPWAGSHQLISSKNRSFSTTTSDIFITDRINCLYRIPLKPPEAPEQIEEQVTGLICVDDKIVYASKDSLTETVVVTHFNSDERQEYTLKNGASGKTFFAETGWFNDKNSFGLFAINTSGRMWTVVNGTSKVLLNPPEGTHVVGLTSHGPGRGTSRNSPALVLLEANLKSISLLSINAMTDVYKSVSEISQINVDPRQGHIAFITQHSELFVFSLKRNALVLHVISGDGL